MSQNNHTQKISNIYNHLRFVILGICYSTRSLQSTTFQNPRGGYPDREIETDGHRDGREIWCLIQDDWLNLRVLPKQFKVAGSAINGQLVTALT